jgi:hypothetical protein
MLRPVDWQTVTDVFEKSQCLDLQCRGETVQLLLRDLEYDMARHSRGLESFLSAPL